MAAQLLNILLLASSVALLKCHMAQYVSDQSFQPELSVMNYRYVTPSKSLPCEGNHDPCLTLEEYASDPAYFISNSIFYFYLGNHQLNTSLKLHGIHHFYFQALNNDTISITFDKLVGITWISCTDISLSSIHFCVTEDFTHLLEFENTSTISLSNIAIMSNVNRVGCSAILIKDSDEANFLDTSFIGISGIYGTAVALERSNITFSGNATFMYNHGYSGGAILSINSSLMFTGINTFINNKAYYMHHEEDIALCSYSITTTAAIAESKYNESGGAVTSLNSLLTISGNSMFIKNYAACMGGAIITSLQWTSGLEIGSNCSILRVNGNCTFAENQANSGGAITINSSSIFEGLVNFNQNSANATGGALSIFESSEVKFLNEKVSFSNNNSSEGSGAMHIYAASVFFSSANEAQNSTEFYGNRVLGFGGAISCYGCRLFFKSNVIFNENIADYGGAISLSDDSELSQPLAILTLYPDYTLYFIRNHAHTGGGALQVDDSDSCYVSRQCFISFATTSSNSIGNVSLVFVNNSAGQGGSVLYGGGLDECVMYYSGNDTNCTCNTHGKQVYSNQAAETFINISHIISQGNKSDISSSTVRICFCNENFEPNCSLSELRMPKLFPGQLFNVTLVGLGQGNHPMPSIIISQIDTDYFNAEQFDLRPVIQSINATCTTIYYRSYSNNIDSGIAYKFYPHNLCHFSDNGVEIHMPFKHCPPGFVVRNQKCDCDEWLKKFIQNCYIDNLSIERTKNNFWISLDNNKTGLLFTQFGCPLDFCVNQPTNVTLDDPNSQSLCDFNRHGLLCGSCKDSLSLALGSLHCISCSDLYILLVVPFALAGVALVVIILLLHLTVDVGTINGLLFYANIIQANRQVFSPRSINFFTVFISWLNLDFGIETCLYDGLTFYVYSWLQYVFPFYIWMLITLIIVVSHYSLTVAKYLGNFNPVAVLATLLLMSYGKILQAIITPLTWGYLTHRDTTEHHHAIWLYDGNIDFFTKPYHIILAVFSILMLLCLFLPYTLILLCGHFLQACPHRRFLTWINKLKPFLDAYHAPYRKNGRYWTGLLLVTRGGLFITFAANAVGSESFNILAICSVAIALLTVKGRVYENCYIDALESSFLLNLSILSVATIYIREIELGNTSQAILSGLSVGIAFITFLGIFLFHVFHQLKRMKILKEGIFFTANKRPFIQDENEWSDHDRLKVERELITSTSQLREPLLETNAINYGT